MLNSKSKWYNYKLIDVYRKVLVDTEDNLSIFEEDENDRRIYKLDYGKKRYNYKSELIED